MLVLAVAACQKQQPQAPENQAMSVDENGTTGELPPNAQVETLPADESSTTPSNQLQNGYDAPEVNDVGKGH